jgi:hypothetical protein
VHCMSLRSRQRSAQAPLQKPCHSHAVVYMVPALSACRSSCRNHASRSASSSTGAPAPFFPSSSSLLSIGAARAADSRCRVSASSRVLRSRSLMALPQYHN